MSENLDPVIHAPARLRIMTTLFALGNDEYLTFPRLQQVLTMTAGNLSTHLRKLEEAGFVEIRKKHELLKPVTSIGITKIGRIAYTKYLAALRKMLDPLS